MFKFVRNVVVRSVVIVAVMAGLTYGSFWLCKGLAWGTTQLTALLTQLGEFVKGNIPVTILTIVLVTIANVIFELISGKAGNMGTRSRRRRAAKSEEE